MAKKITFSAVDPVVSRKAAIPVQPERGGSFVFNAGVKTLAAITAVAGVVSVFVPVVLGIAVFTGLLTFVARKQPFKNNTDIPPWGDNMFNPIAGRDNPMSPHYIPLADR